MFILGDKFFKVEFPFKSKVVVTRNMSDLCKYAITAYFNIFLPHNQCSYGLHFKKNRHAKLTCLAH